MIHGNADDAWSACRAMMGGGVDELERASVRVRLLGPALCLRVFLRGSIFRELGTRASVVCGL